LSLVFQPFPNLSFSCASCNSTNKQKKCAFCQSPKEGRKRASKQPTSSYTGKCTGKKERRAKNPENQPGRDQRVELQEWRHWGKHCSTTAIACTPMPSWVPVAAASSSSPAAAAAVVADVGGDWLALPPPGGWRHRPPPLPPKGSAALPSSLSLVPWF
jgi:hypothetical protein